MMLPMLPQYRCVFASLNHHKISQAISTPIPGSQISERGESNPKYAKFKICPRKSTFQILFSNLNSQIFYSQNQAPKPKTKTCKTKNLPTKTSVPCNLSPIPFTSPHPPEKSPTKKPHIPRENTVSLSSSIKKTPFSSDSQGGRSLQHSRNPVKQAT
jgi:hypothetical protein